MRTLLDYLRLILFLAGVLVGIQVPGFVDQYGQALEAQVRESDRALAEFRRDAERHFDGDLEALIEHYRRAGDPVFTDGGESIRAIHERNQALTAALERFRSGLVAAYRQVFWEPVSDIREAAWENYSYTVRLDPGAIAAGLLIGLVLSLIIESSMRGCGRVMRIGRRRRREEPTAYRF